MHSFIRIPHCYPDLSGVAESWDRLHEAVNEATEANRLVRVTRNELDGAVDSKRRDEATVKERAAAYHHALLREEASRRPLSIAVEAMVATLPTMKNVACSRNYPKGSWQYHAVRANMTACADLLRRGLAAYSRILPYDPVSDRHCCLLIDTADARYFEASTYLESVPMFPAADKQADQNICYYNLGTLWIRCLQLAQRQGGQCAVIVEKYDEPDIQRVISALRRSGWKVAVSGISNRTTRLRIAQPSSGPLKEEEKAPGKPEGDISLPGMIPTDQSRSWMREMARQDAHARKRRTAYQLGRAAFAEGVRVGAHGQADYDAGHFVEIEEGLYVTYEYEFEEAVLLLAD